MDDKTYELHVTRQGINAPIFVLCVGMSLELAVALATTVANMFRQFQLLGFMVLVVNHRDDTYSPEAIYTIEPIDQPPQTYLN